MRCRHSGGSPPRSPTTNRLGASPRSDANRQSRSGSGAIWKWSVGLHDHVVASPNLAGLAYPAVPPHPLRIVLVGDAGEVAVGEPPCLLLAGDGWKRKLDQGRSDPQLCPRTKARPVDAVEAEV